MSRFSGAVVVSTGEKAGIQHERVFMHKSGSFKISALSRTVQGIGYRYCVLLQRSDGWRYEQREEVGPTARVGLSLLTDKTADFCSHTHFR